jgi:hypothetical protein
VGHPEKITASNRRGNGNGNRYRYGETLALWGWSDLGSELEV